MAGLKDLRDIRIIWSVKYKMRISKKNNIWLNCLNEKVGVQRANGAVFVLTIERVSKFMFTQKCKEI